MPTKLSQLQRLARLHQVQTAYYDTGKRRRTASAESLLAVLGALGVGVEAMEDVPEALRRFEQAAAGQVVEPVVVAWEGAATKAELRTRGGAAVAIELEEGERRNVDVTGSIVRLPGDLPRGYHRLVVEHAGIRTESLVIAAPKRAYQPAPDDPVARSWGCFLPLYALRAGGDWGAGDYSSFARLAEWVGAQGGGLLGTLPLLAATLGEPCDPSPYAPVSRTFWNEFYIDIAGIPELADCEAARAMIGADETEHALSEMRSAELVDYRRLMELKRSVLEVLAEDFFARRPERFTQFEDDRRTHPELDRYAEFRAVWEKQSAPWTDWPARMRDGELREGDFDPREQCYYLYAQWIAAQQLTEAAGEARRRGVAIYLDLPLGVRPDGYDVWRHPACFVQAATAGAPPDAVFTKGQDWGCAPMHPAAIRRAAYRPWIDCIRHHLSTAGMLRIDHVMALHRLFWIPRGLSADRGVYVRYRSDEIYAILNVESHRFRAAIVGENLGTVPEEVNRSLRKRGVRTMHVVQYELEGDGNAGGGGADWATDVQAGAVASLNTHDMPTFAAWWRGDDIDDRRELGLLIAEEAEKERGARRDLQRSLVRYLQQQEFLPAGGVDGSELVGRACLAALAKSRAGVVLVNLEDLWQETRPQNIPGTGQERPNWRRKAKFSLEEFGKLTEVVETLAEVNRRRERS